MIGLLGLTALAQRPTPTATPSRVIDPKGSAQTPKGDWVPVSRDMSVKFLTFDWQGGMYALGLDDEMYMAKGNKWERLKPGLKVKSVTVKPDGTVIAPDIAGKYIHSRTGTAWTETLARLDQIAATKDGRTYALLDGKLMRQELGPLNTAARFKYIAAATKTNGLYMVTQDGKVFVYDSDTSSGGEMIGSGSAKCVAGTGIGVKANAFIVGAGSDSKVYFFEVLPKNAWMPVASQTYMKFIAMNPANHSLYGIGVDDKIYRYSGPF